MVQATLLCFNTNLSILSLLAYMADFCFILV